MFTEDLRAEIKEILREVIREELQQQPVTKTVTVREARRLLGGMSDSGVRRMIADGRLEVKEDSQGLKRITVDSIKRL